MISKISAEEMMQNYEGRKVLVCDGRAQNNEAEGYIVAVDLDCMVLCECYHGPEWFRREHHLVALNTIVKVQVFPKAE